MIYPGHLPVCSGRTPGSDPRGCPVGGDFGLDDSQLGMVQGLHSRFLQPSPFTHLRDRGGSRRAEWHRSARGGRGDHPQRQGDADRAVRRAGRQSGQYEAERRFRLASPHRASGKGGAPVSFPSGLPTLVKPRVLCVLFVRWRVLPTMLHRRRGCRCRVVHFCGVRRCFAARRSHNSRFGGNRRRAI